jgi:hypothetical protein
MCLLLVLTLAVNALAAEVPESLVAENLNGQQRIVKTYTLSPDVDPDTLKEPDFTYDGFTYTWAYTTKEEHPYQDAKTVSKVVTVETAKNDLTQILAELSPSVLYDDGEYTGQLALDHTTLSTEAAGYTSKSGKVTETKVIGNLDRNDMSYVPATIEKNGQTLSLANVEWQVTGTALVGETLEPSQYQAVATYSASSTYRAATGYVTTAEYRGTVSASGVKSITYTVVYIGEAILPDEPTEPEVQDVPDALDTSDTSSVPDAPDTPEESAASAPFVPSFAFDGRVLAALGGAALLLLLVGLGARRFARRRNVYVYVPGEQDQEYELAAKFRVEAEQAEVDISELGLAPQSAVAIELKRSLTKTLQGQPFTVRHEYGTYSFPVTHSRQGDWHEFVLKEDIVCDAEEFMV